MSLVLSLFRHAILSDALLLQNSFPLQALGSRPSSDLNKRSLVLTTMPMKRMKAMKAAEAAPKAMKRMKAMKAKKAKAMKK